MLILLLDNSSNVVHDGELTNFAYSFGRFFGNIEIWKIKINLKSIKK